MYARGSPGAWLEKIQVKVPRGAVGASWAAPQPASVIGPHAPVGHGMPRHPQRLALGALSGHALKGLAAVGKAVDA